MTVDLARVLELHEEATRRRELTPCMDPGGCILVTGHTGGHEGPAGYDKSDVIRYRLAATQRDRYAAVVELVPAMVEEIEELRALAQEAVDEGRKWMEQLRIATEAAERRLTTFLTEIRDGLVRERDHEQPRDTVLAKLEAGWT